jgi:hypothetical protein
LERYGEAVRQLLGKEARLTICFLDKEERTDTLLL